CSRSLHRPPPTRGTTVPPSNGFVVQTRMVAAVEDQTHQLAGRHEANRLFDEPPRGSARGDDHDETVHLALDDPTVRDGDERRRIDDDVVVSVTQPFQERSEPRSL